MNVLSLFDGMSCGQIALNKAGIKYDNYFACEIKPHAIETTQRNYPDTIQLGDVTKVKAEDLPPIDLLIGGSPCQDFSRGNKTRDGLEGVKSGLFFEYLRLLQDLKPKNFLLENVIMSDADYATISEYVGTEPVRINSQRLSGQLRDRLYWTNIGPAYIDLFGGRKCVIPQPPKLDVNLQDVLTSGYTDRFKSRALLESDSRLVKNPVKMFHRYFAKGFMTMVFKNEDHYLACRDHYNKNFKGKKAEEIHYSGDPYEGTRWLNQIELERLQTVPEGYTRNLGRDDAACLLGDGWTVDVIAYIFSFLNKNPNV